MLNPAGSGWSADSACATTCSRGALASAVTHARLAGRILQFGELAVDQAGAIAAV